MECPSCARDLDHCHGTLVLHVDALVECTEPDCTDTDLVRHSLTVRCDEVDGECVCTADYAVEYAQAS